MKRSALLALPAALFLLAACGDDKPSDGASKFTAACTKWAVAEADKMLARDNAPEAIKKMATTIKANAGALCKCVADDVKASKDLSDADKKKVFENTGNIQRPAGLSDAGKAAYRKIGRACTEKIAPKN
jgi:hypothetical protein